MNLLGKITISRIPGLKAKDKVFLSSYFTDRQTLLKLSCREIESILGRKMYLRNYCPQTVLLEAERIIKWVETNNAHIVCLDDPAFPAILREIYDPPYLLYFLGTLPPQETPALGVVGTRHASPASERASFKIGLEAGITGVPMISGLALGIDLAAHTGVISASGATWGVLGSGIGNIYPSSSQRAVSRMLEYDGGIMSEYPPLEPPLRWNFPARNRIISGLCRAVCIVEAPERSGALITASFALEQGRDVFVHSAGLLSRTSKGTIKLAEEGASILSSLKEVCSAWGWDPEIVPNIAVVQREKLVSERSKILASGFGEGSLFRFQDTWFKL
ncbi:MAG: DNA-protecting protein DprA [Spirochaetia bacterium]|nr:DNA-protecting protein DprA [Spirochaetia bacterium]